MKFSWCWKKIFWLPVQQVSYVFLVLMFFSSVGSRPIKDLAEQYCFELGLSVYANGDDWCCMCRAGYFKNADCKFGQPKTTDCQKCPFDEDNSSNQSYTDKQNNKTECILSTNEQSCDNIRNTHWVMGSRTSPSSCQCDDGYYHVPGSKESAGCNAHSPCEEGHEPAILGNSTHNTECQACHFGTFSNESSPTKKCRKFSKCGSDTHVTFHGNSTHDVICQNNNGSSTKLPPPAQNEKDYTEVIIGSIVAVCIILAVIIGCVVCRKMRTAQQNNGFVAGERERFLASSPTTPPVEHVESTVHRGREANTSNQSPNTFPNGYHTTHFDQSNGQSNNRTRISESQHRTNGFANGLIDSHINPPIASHATSNHCSENGDNGVARNGSENPSNRSQSSDTEVISATNTVGGCKGVDPPAETNHSGESQSSNLSADQASHGKTQESQLKNTQSITPEDMMEEIFQEIKTTEDKVLDEKTETEMRNLIKITLKKSENFDSLRKSYWIKEPYQELKFVVRTFLREDEIENIEKDNERNTEEIKYKWLQKIQTNYGRDLTPEFLLKRNYKYKSFRDDVIKCVIDAVLKKPKES